MIKPRRASTGCTHTQAARLVAEFRAAVGLRWTPDTPLLDSVEELATSLPVDALRDAPQRRVSLLTAINTKLKVNYGTYRDILDSAATGRVYFNYHEKAAIQQFLDAGDANAFADLLARNGDLTVGAREALAERFRPASADRTLQALRDTIASDPLATSILRSVFRAFVFGCFVLEAAHRHFSGISSDEAYESHYYDYLVNHYPAAFKRQCGLLAIAIDDKLLSQFDDVQQFSDSLLGGIRAGHQHLSNHCYLAVLIRPLSSGGPAAQWRVFSDIVLFAEKHRSVRLETGYFHPRRVRDDTVAHIPSLDLQACRFELAEEGFFFRDCFWISRTSHGSEEPSEVHADLLLLFEKDERDETPIPCPACRSLAIRGNSYPALGVRSWECHNPICPEWSKYDRGNRYSLASLIRQKAIECEAADIPLASIRKWKRDVLSVATDREILEMLVRHYTLVDDPIDVVNWQFSEEDLCGRKVYRSRFAFPAPETGAAARFMNGPYFARMGLECRREPKRAKFENLSSTPGVAVYNGDSAEVLRTLRPASIDGAVTSPPYYNARTYATWKNIYTYLHDMTIIAAEVFRVLKDGAPFLYNVFDYFDNENNIVFSAMGNKRMILGAYFINLFRRLGFEAIGNVIWDKGEIEGKRAYNNGNTSPYYQAPHNCWEHILVFSKGLPDPRWRHWPISLRSKPVFKMFRGENVLGHTAPFPEAVPALLLDRMYQGETVLDPFSGSMTTGLAAHKRGVRSVSIDRLREYCDLGLRLLDQETRSLNLFGDAHTASSAVRSQSGTQSWARQV